MMQMEASSAMLNPKQNWRRSVQHGAAAIMLILIISAGLYRIFGSGSLLHKHTLSAVPHLPPWAGKYYVDAILDAGSAVLLDPDSRHIIYEKRMHEKMYPASTTKILTALIAIENSKPNEIVIVGPEIRLASEDGSKAGLREGDKIIMRDLLYGLMLPSGNDAAYVIAAHVGEKGLGRNCSNVRSFIAHFVKMMNRRAKAAGAEMSHFANPDGYHNSHHFSTAYDLALIAGEAMKQALFREIVKCPSYPRLKQGGISARNSPKDRIRRFGVRQASVGKNELPDRPFYLWENRNLLLDSSSEFYVPEANGIKTGHTNEAGFCLVASATHQNKYLIAVVLKSTITGVWNDAAILLSHGFQNNILNTNVDLSQRTKLPHEYVSKPD
jgi:D-alanyl-D-alanine carboxypeptidase (penicillin-binding protein 5/6)